MKGSSAITGNAEISSLAVADVTNILATVSRAALPRESAAAISHLLQDETDYCTFAGDQKNILLNFTRFAFYT